MRSIEKVKRSALPSSNDLCRILAADVAAYLQIDEARLASGASFHDLIPDFDSLLLVEVLLLLEGKYDIELEDAFRPGEAGVGLPSNIDELAVSIEAARSPSQVRSIRS